MTWRTSGSKQERIACVRWMARAIRSAPAAVVMEGSVRLAPLQCKPSHLRDILVPTDEEILAEIRRTADANGGIPLGSKSFATLTGIPTSRWMGRYWRSWSDAVREAGLEPNRSLEPHGRDALVFALTKLVSKLGRYPTQADMMLERRADPSFPAMSVYDRQLGKRADMIEAVRAYASENVEYRPVLDLLPEAVHARDASLSEDEEDRVEGTVYMFRHGKHYKIGHTFDVPRRQREISLALPEKAVPVHTIRTDDPKGIEVYWHKRFAEKRTNGEWFTLTREDIRAFKRRKFM